MSKAKHTLTDEELNTVLNTETARISWLELQPQFARGHVILVQPSIDLIHVARELIRDHKAQFQAWLDDGQIAGVTNAQAQTWYDTQAEVWAVVVAPWVLIQTDRQTETNAP
ncbi:MAG: DUF2288 family protein [Natronospirillum sp.]